ncbi:hypothetical protein [Vreelandella gomseomensis]|uniref:Uncharacterized protein n=1 Tax=Vreelandella gomseomensis TaxID=370766 RepID=A0ABU1GEH8_9GAMM|nr:hypothetical protein [Halomonas gomseomensis]MDR5875871.1 hypothetical protein [Halomonas gomseomensis]
MNVDRLDYFAGLAMQQFLIMANDNELAIDFDHGQIAYDAYALAKVMVEERERLDEEGFR